MQKLFNGDALIFLANNVLLLFGVILLFLALSTSSYQIVRGEPDDMYDAGTYFYNGSVVQVDCSYKPHGKCTCYGGRTFVFSSLSTGSTLTPKCFEAFNDVEFDCQFRWKDFYYVKAIKVPLSNTEKAIDTVQYRYQNTKSISSINRVSFWNMSWVPITSPPFTATSNQIKWTSYGQSLQSFAGLLLKFDIAATYQRSSHTGCLLLKIAGTKNYPLTSITSQLTTNIPTTSSLISTQIKTSSSVPVATPSFTSKVISSSSIDAASPLYLPTSYKLTSTFVSITSPVGKSSMFVDLSMRSMVSAKHVTKSYFAPMSSIVQSSPTSNILHSSKKSIPSFQPSYPPSKKVTARSISVFSKSKPSSITVSSYIPNVNKKGTDKQEGDQVPLIVGASLGGLFGMVAVVIGFLLCRRRFYDGKQSHKKDTLKLQLTSENYHSSGTVDDERQKRIANPTYDEGINMRSMATNRNGPTSDLYEMAYDGRTNQSLDQVYSEIDGPKEPVCKDVEPIYKEVEEEGPIYKEVDEDGPIYKEIEEDGPVYEETDGTYQSVDSGVIENPNAYETLKINANQSEQPTFAPQEIHFDDTLSPVYQVVEAENGGPNAGNSVVPKDEPIYREINAETEFEV